MLLNLFNEMRAAKGAGVGARAARPDRCPEAPRGVRRHGRVLLPGAHHHGQGRAPLRQVRPGLRRLLQGPGEARRPPQALIPEEWLRKEFERLLTDEEKAQIQSLGGLDKLIEEFKKRLEEQKERHAGGNKWIGTGGTSPFGSGGFNPEGIRVGDAGKRQGKAAKVWDQREYKNLDDQVELGTRNIKIALRRLRKFAREGAAEELDIDGTIDHTRRTPGCSTSRCARSGATVKLLLLLDIGGSMDAHVKVCEELFSACRTEFKHLGISTSTTSSTSRCGRTTCAAAAERTATFDLLHKYGPDYKVVFVGDAAIAPYEITRPAAASEHWNEEAGYVWMQRFMEKYKEAHLDQPYPKDTWNYTASTGLVRELVRNRCIR